MILQFHICFVYGNNTYQVPLLVKKLSEDEVVCHLGDFSTSYTIVFQIPVCTYDAKLCTSTHILFIIHISSPPSPPTSILCTYPNYIFRVDIGSFPNKVFHYILVSMKSSHMKGSTLIERRNYKSKPEIDKLLSSFVMKQIQ